MIDAGNLAIKADRALKRKRWKNILKELEYADTTVYPNNVNIKIQLGRFYLFMRKLSKARKYFESAKKLNPRISIQKELGNIYLELGQYPFAISLLSDHINLNPADLEAHNLLVKCYYETDRYEVAIDHLTMLLKFSDNKPCFYNNLIFHYRTSFIALNISSAGFTVMEFPKTLYFCVSDIFTCSPASVIP
jgi:tetratricopeptide (TPR) repeat protein